MTESTPEDSAGGLARTRWGERQRKVEILGKVTTQEQREASGTAIT